MHHEVQSRQGPHRSIHRGHDPRAIHLRNELSDHSFVVYNRSATLGTT